MANLILKALLFMSVATLTESQLGVSLGPIQISMNKAATAGLLAWVGVLALLSPSGAGIPKHTKNYWILFFGAALIPASVTSLMLGRPLPSLINGLIQPISLILFYFVLIYTIRKESDLRLVTWALVLGLGVAAFTSLVGIGRVNETSYYGRAGGLGGNPNLLAVNCVMGIGMMLPLLLESRGKNLTRLVLLGLAVVMLLAIVQTVSRAGFLVLMVLGGFILVRSRRLDLIAWAIPVALIAVIGFLFFAPETYFQRMSTIGSEAADLASLSTENPRIHGWYWALRAFQAYPFTGVGLGTFHTFVMLESHDTTTSPHSTYFQVLAHMGLVGMIPYMAMLVLSWFDMSVPRRIRRRLGDRATPTLIRLENWALYYQACFLVWLVAGLVSPFALDKGPWFLMAIATILRQMARNEARVVEEEDEPATFTTERSEVPATTSFAPG